MADHRPLLPGAEGKKHGRPRLDDRMVLNGIFFVLRTGTPWRDLPTLWPPTRRPTTTSIFGPRKGIWLRMFETLAAHSPQSLQLIDSSIIRAHQHAGGAKKGVRTAPSAVLVEDRAPRPMPRSIRQGSRYASCSRKATLSTDHAPVLIVQLEPSRDSSPNVAITRAPVSIWSLAAATISHLDLSRPNLS